MASAKKAKIKRTNVAFTEAEQSEISRIMEKGATRKKAIRKLRANQKAATALRQTAEKHTPDFKQAAANDRPATPVAAPIVQPAKPEPKPQTAAGKARSIGLQRFVLAGRPTREQVLAVYGERGPVMTWEQRATAGCDWTNFQKFLTTGKKAVPAPTVKGTK